MVQSLNSKNNNPPFQFLSHVLVSLVIPPAPPCPMSYIDRRVNLIFSVMPHSR